jgi:hypothetical protein
VRRPTVCLDLDETLHASTLGWHDGTMYGDPLPGAFDALQALHEAGVQLVVSTCRLHPPRAWDDLGAFPELEGAPEGAQAKAQRAAVLSWFERHKGDRHTFYIAAVTSEKPVASAYVDDRAVSTRAGWPAALREVSQLLARDGWEGYELTPPDPMPDFEPRTEAEDYVSHRPTRVRKRPVAVEAMRWEPDRMSRAASMVGWLTAHGADFDHHGEGVGDRTPLNIHTLEGTMTAHAGDWIIRGTKGEFYPVREDIFLDTYVLVEVEEPAGA